MDEIIAGADKEVLVEIVRLTQKQALTGSKGGWKDFLNSYDKKFGAGLSDPAKRSIDILVAFLQTFAQEENLKFFGKIIRCHGDRKAIAQYIKHNLNQESPNQKLVRLTIEHPLYMQNFTFPSYNEEWVVIPLGKISKAMKSTYMMAIDCEMVLCQDGTDAVVKVCAVDHNLEVILDSLVKPGKAIADYKTDITGVSAEDLERETTSLTDIQKSLKKLLKHGTILIGHSLHKDLEALKIDHTKVVDTTFIFRCMNLPIGFSPSLNNLCKTVLGTEVRKNGEPHDCLNDAKAAMKLVLAKLEHGFDDPIMVAGNCILESDLAKLLIHRVPVHVPCQELLNLFHKDFEIHIQPDLKTRGQSYSTFAVFNDSRTANEAFNGIQGLEHKDTLGRRQKRVTLKTSTGTFIDVCVRKMIPDGPIGDFEMSTKRSAPEDAKESKKQRMCLHECNHVEEIEKLRRELQQREKELFNLQKIVAELTTEHELCN